jgi:hypothetical protein
MRFLGGFALRRQYIRKRSARQSAVTRPSPEEFVPLPYFPWLERPATLALDLDEVATAIYLANGHLAKAADLLKVNPSQIKHEVRKSPRLRNLITRLGEPEEPA